MKFIKRNWAINNAMPVFFIGFFLSITNDDGILKILGFGIMLFSFYFGGSGGPSAGAQQRTTAISTLTYTHLSQQNNARR